jgi:hypothetical protein
MLYGQKVKLHNVQPGCKHRNSNFTDKTGTVKSQNVQPGCKHTSSKFTKKTGTVKREQRRFFPSLSLILRMSHDMRKCNLFTPQKNRSTAFPTMIFTKFTTAEDKNVLISYFIQIVGTINVCVETSSSTGTTAHCGLWPVEQ